MTARAGRGAVALPAVLALTGCGGGAPLLHPAHTLTQGEVTFAAGTSEHLALGGLQHARDGLDEADATPAGAYTPAARKAFVEGAVARFAMAPGVAPFVAGRAGLGSHNEAGFTYVGRGARIDGRHAFEWPKLALSVGLGATGTFGRPGDLPRDRATEQLVPDSGFRSISLSSISGYGLELPVVFGYRSDADVVRLWAGVRAGFERDTFSASLLELDEKKPLAVNGDATRFWGGGLVGFSVGLAPIEVRVEVDAAYERAHGSLEAHDGKVTGDVAGWSLTPAMAICSKF